MQSSEIEEQKGRTEEYLNNRTHLLYPVISEHIQAPFH